MIRIWSTQGSNFTFFLPPFSLSRPCPQDLIGLHRFDGQFSLHGDRIQTLAMLSLHSARLSKELATNQFSLFQTLTSQLVSLYVHLLLCRQGSRRIWNILGWSLASLFTGIRSRFINSQMYGSLRMSKLSFALLSLNYYYLFSNHNEILLKI